MRLTAWLARVIRRLFGLCTHEDHDTIRELRDGVLYLRCRRCLRRSQGWSTVDR